MMGNSGGGSVSLNSAHVAHMLARERYRKFLARFPVTCRSASNTLKGVVVS